MVSGKPSNQSARQVDSSPTTRLLFYVCTHQLWEYVLQSRREYGHVVTLHTYVLHIGCAYGPAVAEPTWIILAQVRESTSEGSNVLQTV
jgi:hypothetical protein